MESISFFSYIYISLKNESQFRYSNEYRNSTVIKISDKNRFRFWRKRNMYTSMTLKFRETHHHRKRRRNRTSFGKRRNRGGEEERHGNELEVFPTGKWQRWQGEKIMPRSEFMSRRQTNSSHVSPSENTRLGRARAPIYTCTREHLMLSPCRSSRFPAIYKEIASRTNVIFQTFPLHAPPPPPFPSPPSTRFSAAVIYRFVAGSDNRWITKRMYTMTED